MECKRCGAQINEEMKFCVKCGAALTEPAAEEKTVSAEEPAAPTAHAASSEPAAASWTEIQKAEVCEEQANEVGWTAFIWSMISVMFSGSLFGLIFSIVARNYVNKALLWGAKCVAHIRAAKIISLVTLIVSIVSVALVVMYVFYVFFVYFIFFVFMILFA